MRNSGVSRCSSLILVLLTLTLGLTQAQPPAQSSAAAGPAGAGSDTDVLREQIVAQERAGLDSLKTGDLTTFGASTANDAIFVDAHGPASKTEVMEHTAEFRLHDYAMSDVRFVRLSGESGLIVYALTESGTSHGKEFSARVHVSSLWVRRGGKWMCLFSQETAAR